MSFLLDTCVLSEGSRSQSNAGVLAWLTDTPDEAKFVSVISLSEIRFGILCAPMGVKREALGVWYSSILRPSVEGRILSYDEETALKWAEIRARHKNAPVLDCQIAATALVHGFTLVTRNLRDFPFSGLAVFNPWSK